MLWFEYKDLISLWEVTSCGRGHVSVAMSRTAVPNSEIRNPNIEIRNKFKSPMFKWLKQTLSIAISKTSAAQRSFGHLDFGHLILFRDSDLVLRIYTFHRETPHAPPRDASSKPSPLGGDCLLRVVGFVVSRTAKKRGWEILWQWRNQGAVPAMDGTLLWVTRKWSIATNANITMSLGISTSPMVARPWNSKANSSLPSWCSQVPRWTVCCSRRRYSLRVSDATGAWAKARRF